MAGMTSINPMIPNDNGFFVQTVHFPFNDNKLHGPSKTMAKRNNKKY
jgi:hypothetical protein